MRFYEPMKLPDSSVKTIHSRLDDILSSGYMVNGEYCRKLEDELHRYIDADYISVCSSGTRALEIAYRAIVEVNGLYYGLVVPSFTWRSLQYLPNIASFNDAELDTWFVQDTVRSARVLIKHHTFGSIDNRDFTGWVIQDAAHAFGGHINDFRTVTCFSLAPTKPFTSMNGGVIVTNYVQLEVRINANLIPWLGRMTEIQAVVGLEYLKIYREGIRYKERLAYLYKKNIENVDFQFIPYDSTFSVFGLLAKDLHQRECLQLALGSKHKIPYQIYYVPISPTLNALEIYKRIICLPIHSGVSLDKAKEISDIINEVTTSG